MYVVACIHFSKANFFFFFFYRLHAKLGEEEDAAKLYIRFIAQAEATEVYKLST